MNSARPKPVAEVNLEEFERRLRASAAPQAGVEDPLAELTRLVDAIGFERTPSERALEASRPAPKPDLRLATPAEPPKPPPPAPPPQPQLEIEPPPAAPESAALPPLADAEPALRPSFDAEDLDSSAFEPPLPSMETIDPAAEPASLAAPARAQPPRARNWGLKVGGLVAAAAVMAGAVVVFKVGGHARSGAPVLVLAPTTPTKVAPPNEVTIRTANESGALLNRDTAQPTPTPPKLVDPPEAPVDLSARPEASPSATGSIAAPSPTASAASPTPSASAAAPSPTASATAAADASPVAPSANTPIVATAAPEPTPVSPVSADPSRVKTISVRPDGSLISSGYEAARTAQAQPAAPAPSPQKQADADTEASSPAVALPTKLSPPKAVARVVSKTETTAPADAGDGPAPVAPKAAAKATKPKPAVEAEAKTDDAEAPAPSGGGYAVQFAAPRSEREARALVKRFQSKFADAVGGAQFAVRKAERHGETIYRVRAVGLTKADAKTMCAKVKGDGGDCYYAKD